jgi:hypothetical protein
MDVFTFFAQCPALPLTLLKQAAQELSKCYSSLNAYDDALSGDNLCGVPVGAPWIPLPAEQARSAASAKPSRKRKEPSKHRAKKSKPTPPFVWDRSLAQAAAFKFEAILSREFLLGTADGDAGRAYEALKVSLSLASHGA